MLNSKVQDFIHLTNDLLPKQKLFWIRFIREKTTNICMSILSISSMDSSEKKTIKFSKRKTYSNVTGKNSERTKTNQIAIISSWVIFKKNIFKKHYLLWTTILLYRMKRICKTHQRLRFGKKTISKMSFGLWRISTEPNQYRRSCIYKVLNILSDRALKQ